MAGNSTDRLIAAIRLGKISEEEMRRLNYAADGRRTDIKEAVREFLGARQF